MENSKAPYSAVKELIFQLVLHLVVFIFYSFDKNDPSIKSYQVVYFFSYALAALFINYFLLPRFYYQKKYVLFFTWVLLIVIALILAEELVFEAIYFPDSRAKRFPGLLFTLVQIMPVITILVGFKFGWDALGKQRQVEQLKMAVKESELQYLKSQINPHFLFNNLNNLYSYAIENSPKTPEIILELSGVLRYMLYECREDFVPLSNELKQLENYINLNELQIEERGEVRFNGSSVTGFRIAPLILMVFVENAFKHSTASQANNILIDIKVAVSPEGLLRFYCKNSYQPQSNTDHLSQGIGLQNVRKRLDLIYPQAYDLDIQKNEHFYEVHLLMDLTKAT